MDAETDLQIIRAGLYCAPSSSTNTAAVHALVRVSEALEAVLLRDWAVRVLDAWAAAHLNYAPRHLNYAPSNIERTDLLPRNHGNGCFEVWVLGVGYTGTNEDAARLAAADALAPELGDKCPVRP